MGTRGTSGNPADEISKWANANSVGLLVMALNGDACGGPRMGSVTYRAIVKTGVLTLALPPARSSQAIGPTVLSEKFPRSGNSPHPGGFARRKSNRLRL